MARPLLLKSMGQRSLNNWSRRLTRQISLGLFVGLGVFSFFELATIKQKQLLAEWDLRKALIYSNLKGLSASIQSSNELMRDENIRPLFRDLELRSAVVVDLNQKIIGGYSLLNRNEGDVLLLPALTGDEGTFAVSGRIPSAQNPRDEYFGEVDEWGLFEKNLDESGRSLSIAVPLLGPKVNNQRLRLATLLLNYDLLATNREILQSQIRFVAILFSFAFILLLGIQWALRSVEENMNLRLSNEGLTARRQLMEIFAHDVRKPFQIIRTLRESLRPNLKAQELQQLIGLFGQELDGGLRSVQSMIDDTLELASGRELAIEETPLAKLLEDAATSIVERQPRLGAQIHWDLQFDGAVEWDPSRMGRVFWNLFNNAAQAMKNHSHLFVSSRVLSDENIEICVRNTGSEILPEHLDKIFLPGFTHGRRRGTGLGLAVVRDLVERHQGLVSCQSSLERGVEFKIILPRIVRMPTKDLKNAS